MHDHGGRGGPARPPRPRWRPYLAALVAVLALMLAVAACGGGNGGNDGVASLGGDQATATTSPGGSQDERQADLAYARCMRQHGINLPDPKAGGQRTVWELPPGISRDDPKFQMARQACRQYRENGGEVQRPSPQQQQEMLAFARCMRRHGIDMPDPSPDGSLPDRGRGLNPDDPKFKAAERACPGFRPKY
jgi:hypothetical protein